MDINKEFSLLLETYETLLSDYDLERTDVAQAEEQAFKHFDLIIDFIRQEERERAQKIIEEVPCCATRVCFGICKKWKQEALKKT